MCSCMLMEIIVKDYEYVLVCHELKSLEAEIVKLFQLRCQLFATDYQGDDKKLLLSFNA